MSWGGSEKNNWCYRKWCSRTPFHIVFPPCKVNTVNITMVAKKRNMFLFFIRLCRKNHKPEDTFVAKE